MKQSVFLNKILKDAKLLKTRTNRSLLWKKCFLRNHVRYRQA